MPAPDTVSEVRDFSPGLNLLTARTNRTPGETDLAENVEWLLDGSVAVRPPFDAAPAALAALAGETVESLHVFSVNLGVAPPEAGYRAAAAFTPPATATVTVMITSAAVWCHAVAETAAAPTHTFKIARPAAAGRTVARVAVAAMAGRIYLALGAAGQVTKLWWDTADVTKPKTATLADPTAPRTYRLATLGEESRADREQITTSASWSTNRDGNLFADVQNSDTAAARFPACEVMAAVDVGPSSIMFAASGSVLRWSHPLAWLDSGYFGYAPALAGPPKLAESGDRGPDWPAGSANLTGEHDAARRLFGPEDWALEDHTDVNPSDGDSIVALAHWLDTMLIFKRHSVWQILGSIPDEIFLLPISRRTGTVSGNSVAVTPYGVWWWDQPEGLYRWDQENGAAFVGDKLGTFDIPAAAEPQIAVGYHDHRLFVALPTSPKPRTFVLDLRVGGWSEWTVPLAAFSASTRNAAAPHVLAANPTPPCLVAATLTDGDAAAADVCGGRSTPYRARLRVGPVYPAAGDYGRWRRFRVEADNPGTDRAVIDATPEYHDPDPANSRTLPVSEQFAVPADTQAFRSLSKLGRPARSMSVLLGWVDRQIRVTSASFTHWPSKRNRSDAA